MGITKFSRKQWRAYLFILPAVLLFAILLWKPMIESILFSFFDVSLRGKEFIGLKNYATMFKDPLFWTSFKNTLLFVVIVVPTKTLLALGLALILTRRNKKLQSVFRGAFYLPVVSAGVVMSVVWWWIFSPLHGPLNYALSLIGISPIMWLSSPNWARFAVVLVILNWSTGLAIILYLSALLGVPRKFYEAAEMDGASKVQQFFKITLPFILPITTFILVTTTIGMWQTWQAVYLLTAGGPIHATTTVVFRIFDVGFTTYKFGLASAYATVLFLLILSIAYFQFKWLNREIEF